MGEAPLLRLTLIRLDEAEYQLVWTFHHALLDGRSLLLVLKEAFAFYESFRVGQDLELPLPRPYRDYIEWLQSQDPSRGETYWRQQFKGFIAPTPLVVEKASNSQANVTDFHHQSIFLGEATSTALKKLARDNGLTLHTLLQGAWALLLYRYSGEEDVVYGVVRACRKSSIEGADEIVGLFINTLPLRVRVTPEALLLDWLKEVRAQWFGMRDYEHTPLVQIQKWSAVPSGKPLFESILVFESHELSYKQLTDLGGNWARRSFRHYEQTGYPITVLVFAGVQLCLQIEFDRNRFDPLAIARMLNHLKTLLEGMLAGSKQRLRDLPILTQEERHQLTVEWNDTRADYPKDLLLHQLFEAQVERAPEAVALAGPSLARGSASQARLSYAELNRRANQLAQHLQTLGVGSEVLVAVCMERTVETVIGVLAILKAGGAYVPLDPAYPPDRTAFILEETQAAVVLTQLSLAAFFPRHQAHVVCVDDPNLQTEIQRLPSHNPQFLSNHPHPSNLAYVIFTSGSTGRPKGVAIEHHSAVTLLHWAREVFTPEVLAGVLASTSICFDLSVFELFATLSWGGKVIMAENALQLPSLPEANEVTLINTVPSAMTELLRLNAVPPSVRVVNLAGEPLHQSLVNQIYQLPTIHKVHDLYGPSETTTYSTFALRRRDGVATIGRPIANTQVYLLNAHQQLAPLGVPGELYIGGDGLARGYLRRPEMTAERFIPNPFSTVSGSRLYKTGDLARYLPDGNLEYLGRLDHQVKIRGFRIELGEIETVLRQHPAVGQAAVIAREDTPVGKRLIAYVVLNPDYQSDASEGESQSEHLGGRQAISDQTHQEMVEVDDRRLNIFVRNLVPQLRGLLEKKLPAYMVPSAFMLLEKFPLTPNGKLDRMALPSPGESSVDLETAWAPPDNEAEQVIARVWEELLGVSRVGRDNNFFDLGGHSLLLMRIRNKLEQAFARQLPVVELFRHPTVRSLAKYLTDHEAEATTLARNREQIARHKESAQRRLQRRKQIAVEEG
jgi:amino acid adenylation domain-containing protein